MTEAASVSETSINFYQTARRTKPEVRYVHNRRCVNLKPLRLKHILQAFVNRVCVSCLSYVCSDLLTYAVILCTAVSRRSLRGALGI